MKSDGASRVYRAVNYTTNQLAACKVIPITQQSWNANTKKELFKEIKVHSQLKYTHVLDFLGSATYEDTDDTTAQGIVPAVYMLLELAAGGDLFDKIGTHIACGVVMRRTRINTLAPLYSTRSGYSRARSTPILHPTHCRGRVHPQQGRLSS